MNEKLKQLIEELKSSDTESVENAFNKAKEKQLIGDATTSNDFLSLILSKMNTIQPKQMDVNIKGAELVTIKGEKGDKGDKGDTGEKGKDGKDGNDGETGPQGNEGIDGKDGLNGKDGIDGINGQDGKDGKDGVDGKDGSPDKPEQIAEKLNTLTKVLDFSVIKNFPDMKRGGNVTSLLRELDDVSLGNTDPTNGYVLTYDSTPKRWVASAPSGGSSISLLTNGAPNSSQTVFNLSQGSNITLTDIGGGVIVVDAVQGAGGFAGTMQYSNAGVLDGVTGSYSDGSFVYFNSDSFYITTDITDRTKAGTFAVTNLDTIYTYELPKANGTMVLSVNGTPPDSAGDVTISAGIGGSGTTNEIAYFTGASTIGSLATATYPSLTELSYVKGVTSSIQTQIDAKGTGTVTSVNAAGGTTGLSFSGGPVTTSGTLTLAGTLIGANGGTGVANTGKTITLGGNLVTTGAFNTTFAQQATATITLPTATSTLLANNLGISGGSTYLSGTAATDKTIFQTTSGNQVTGVSNLYTFKSGNNGANELVRFGDGVASNIGEFSAWAAGQSSSSTYMWRAGTNFTYFNAGTDLRLMVGATGYINMLSGAGTVAIQKPLTMAANATVTLMAGTTSLAPLNFTSGTNKTTAAAGNMEYNGTNLFFTNGGAQRQEIPLIQQSRVSSQFNKTSDTTLANVTGLTATVVAGKFYRFEAKLYTTSNAAGGVKVAIAGTATATAIVYEGMTTDAGLTTQSRGTALATAVGAVTAVTAAYILISGTITVNAAGTLTVQFAQNASNGTASSVLVGSTLVLIEMA